MLRCRRLPVALRTLFYIALNLLQQSISALIYFTLLVKQK